MNEAGPPAHPIGLIVTDDLRRSRLTVFFRLLLAIPHLIVLYILGLIIEIVLFVAWLVALVLGRLPQGLHDFIAGYLRYLTYVSSYLLILANPYPPFSFSSTTYPINARIDPPQRQNRLTILVRLLLAIPALLLAVVFRAVNMVVALFGWFYSLVLGRMHEGMRNLSAWMLGYEVQTYAYVFLLTGRYPSLAGAPTA
jgi:hypothetical protein